MPKNMAAEVLAGPSAPPTRIRVTKDQAADVSVGDKISVTVSGEVAGIIQCLDYSGKEPKFNGYEIELKGSTVSDIKGKNAADKAVERMRGK